MMSSCRQQRLAAHCLHHYHHHHHHKAHARDVRWAHALPQQLQRPYMVSVDRRLAYVEALLDIMTNMVEIMWRGIYQDVGELAFPISMRGFIREVLKRSHTTYTTAQIAICYLFQTQQAIRTYMLKESKSIKRDYISCGRRMFLASLIVASKYVQDKTYRNSAWASIARLPVQEVNLAERIFLELSDYQLYVSQSVFDDLHRLLRDYVADALAEPPVASLHQISFAWTPDLCRCVVLPQSHLLMPTTAPQMTTAYASSGAKRPRADTPDFNTAHNKRCKSQTPPCLLRPPRPHFVLGHAPCI